MRYRFQFRRYRLPFRAVVRSAHGPWVEREGLLVKIEQVSESGVGGSGFRFSASGFGEAAPISWFGTETADEDEAAARALGEWVEGDLIERVPARCGCLRNAIRSALDDIERPKVETAKLDAGTEYRAVAGLLPAGKAAIAAVGPKAEMGFRTFKWKVGVGDVADELVLLDELCSVLPSGAKLRLDANGAWDRRRAERWMERCAERPVEFVEQPCFAALSQSASERGKVDDVLLGLAGDYPTPIALDESLVGDGDVERWIAAGWPGFFVVKPTLLANVPEALARLTKAKANVVFSSALETAVGARAALRTAFAWDGKPHALGFGVWPLFQDAQFDGGAAVPFIRREDAERRDVEALWNALG